MNADQAKSSSFNKNDLRLTYVNSTSISRKFWFFLHLRMFFKKDVNCICIASIRSGYIILQIFDGLRICFKFLSIFVPLINRTHPACQMASTDTDFKLLWRCHLTNEIKPKKSAQINTERFINSNLNNKIYLIPVQLLLHLTTLLRLKRQTCRWTCQQTWYTDRLTGFFAPAILTGIDTGD